LGDTEWFDVLYRVYLFALVGTIVVVWLSDAIDGILDDSITSEQLLTRGPSVAGIAAAVAFAVGLRNGADGGPMSIEPADIRHLLLSPIDRRRVLLRPIIQRLRSIAFALSLGLGVIGQLVAREVEGSPVAWAASGVLVGTVIAVLYVCTAVISHAVRVPGPVASVVGGLVVAWQAAVAWTIWQDTGSGVMRIGPMNLVGSLAFWGVRQRGLDLVAIATAAALVAGASFLGGQLRLEPLERRGQLVSQLRFAATVQDIRTVVLLRRQLRAESVRARPLFSLGSRRPGPPTGSPGRSDRPFGRPHRARRAATVMSPGFVWRRSALALGRLPVGRLMRIATLAAVAGASASLSVNETPLILVLFVGAVFFVGLECLEPLAQEIDHPDLTDAVPADRGWLFTHLLVAPAALLAIAGLIGAAAATAVEPSHAAAAFALAVPLAWAGAIGAVVTTVRDAPEPPGTEQTTIMGGPKGGESPFAMPEFAGFSNVITGAMPIVFSAIAAVPIVALSIAPEFSTVWRSILGVTLCIAMLLGWTRRRDRWAVKVREFFAAGRAETYGTGATS